MSFLHPEWFWLMLLPLFVLYAGERRDAPALWMAAAMLLFVSGGLAWHLFRHTGEHAASSRNSTIDIVYRASVHPLSDAEYRCVSTQPDEIVRLSSGTITVTVDPLKAGERFRVITRDAEVEVVGTVFEVTASKDELVAVRVLSGTVAVRPVGSAAVVLAQGERWPVESETRTPRDRQTASNETENRQSAPILGRAKRKNRPPRNRPEQSTGEKKPQASAPVEEATESPGTIDAEAFFNSGWGHFRSGDYPAAADDFGRVMQITKEWALREDAVYWCAIAHLKAGNTSTAQSVMIHYLADYPQARRAAEIATRLGWMALEKGRAAEARHYFENGLNSDDPKVKRSARNGLDTLEKSSD